MILLLRTRMLAMNAGCLTLSFSLLRMEFPDRAVYAQLFPWSSSKSCWYFRIYVSLYFLECEACSRQFRSVSCPSTQLRYRRFAKSSTVQSRDP